MKEKLFEKAHRARVNYMRVSNAVPGTKTEGVAYGRFLSLWEMVEELELVDEYEAWLTANGCSDEIQ